SETKPRVHHAIKDRPEAVARAEEHPIAVVGLELLQPQQDLRLRGRALPERDLIEDPFVLREHVEREALEQADVRVPEHRRAVAVQVVQLLREVRVDVQRTPWLTQPERGIEKVLRNGLAHLVEDRELRVLVRDRSGGVADGETATRAPLDGEKVRVRDL